MVSIGDIVKINYIPEDNLGSTLLRFPSTYGYNNINFSPRIDKEYIVCDGDPINGYHLVQRDDLSVPLGFCLMYIDNLPYVRITQVNYEPEPVHSVVITGKEHNIPGKGYNIGSTVILAIHHSNRKI